MVDNVVLNPGTGGDTIATEDIAGVEYQRIKIADGDASSTTLLKVTAEDEALSGAETGILAMAQRKDAPANNSGTDGDAEYLQMSAGRLWVSPLGFPVTISTDVIRPADTLAYAAADAISDSTTAPTAGGFTFANAARKSGGSGIIVGAVIATTADQATKLAGELWLFDKSVTNINDNAAFFVTDAEIKTVVDIVPFTFFDSGNNGVCVVPDLNIMFTCDGTANLRFLIRARNAYTPISAETFTFRLKILQVD